MAEAEQASCNQIAANLAELDEDEMVARVQRANYERDAAQEAYDRLYQWVHHQQSGGSHALQWQMVA